MDLEVIVQEIREELKAINSKLDKYNESTIKNTNDISWLKKGAFGSFFTYIAAIMYAKFGM